MKVSGTETWVPSGVDLMTTSKWRKRLTSVLHVLTPRGLGSLDDTAFIGELQIT